MIKKLILSLLLASLFFISLSHFSDAFSQPKIKLELIKDRETLYLRILTPSQTEKLYAEVYSGDNQLKAIIARDYFGMIKEAGVTYNEFIVSNEAVKFTQEDSIKLFPNTLFTIEQVIKDLPATTVVRDKAIGKQYIKVMTFNIHHRRDKVGNDTLNHIKEIIQVEKPDIIGLQEVDKNKARSNFQDQLKELADTLSMNYVYGTNIRFLKGEYGNGILTKYPITYSNNIHMSGREPRGLLHAQIAFKEHKVNFFVTHLGLKKEERDRQIDTMNTYIDLYKDNLILVGDFNATSDDIPIFELQNKLKDTAQVTSQTAKPTFNIFNKEKRIDYIFVSKETSILRYKVIKKEYSDHYPVTASLELE